MRDNDFCQLYCTWVWYRDRNVKCRRILLASVSINRCRGDTLEQSHRSMSHLLLTASCLTSTYITLSFMNLVFISQVLRHLYCYQSVQELLCTKKRQDVDTEGIWGWGGRMSHDVPVGGAAKCTHSKSTCSWCQRWRQSECSQSPRVP